MMPCSFSSTSSNAPGHSALSSGSSQVPEVATPPALDALPGANRMPLSWNTSIASGVDGMFAPSPTAIAAVIDQRLAPARVQLVLRGAGQARCRKGRSRCLAALVVLAPSERYCAIHRLIRRALDLLDLFNSMRRSMPSLSYIQPVESLIATTLPPSSVDLLSRIDGDVAGAGDDDRLALVGMFLAGA